MHNMLQSRIRHIAVLCAELSRADIRVLTMCRAPCSAALRALHAAGQRPVPSNICDHVLDLQHSMQSSEEDTFQRQYNIYTELWLAVVLSMMLEL